MGKVIATVIVGSLIIASQLVGGVAWRSRHGQLLVRRDEDSYSYWLSIIAQGVVLAVIVLVEVFG